jgi:TRAP-type uncharacterized transport system fused permease subunit
VLPAETLLWGFALPAILFAGSVLLVRTNAWLQALGCVLAAACAQWAHFAELAPLTATPHSSRDWLWLLAALGALLGLSKKPAYLPALLGPAAVILLSLRLEAAQWPLWQRVIAALLTALALLGATRVSSGAHSGTRCAPAWVLLLAATSASLLLAHFATLALYAAGIAGGMGLVALGQWRRPQHELTRPLRAGLAALLIALVLSGWLYADLSRTSALCLLGGLLALGWPSFWTRTVLVGLFCAASLAPGLLERLNAAPNPYR